MPLPETDAQFSRARIFAACALGIVMALVILQSAIYEDAYITFRVVDNFLHGYGLRWNIDERVQVYTHPLWMLLHIPLQYLIGHIYTASLLLCWACTLGMFTIFWKLNRDNLTAWTLTFVIPFMLSKTLVTYSSSGFENPLLHLLFAAFVWSHMRLEGNRRWFALSLWTSLSLTTRLDTVFFYAPVWGMLLFLHRRIPLRPLLLGMLPLVAWELFSLFYYGFLFPNTKYAKLHIGVETEIFLLFGLRYLSNLALVDAFSAVFLLLSLVAAIKLIRRRRSNPAQACWLLGIVAGIVAYTMYVVMVGGTYLSGRLLSLPILAALYVISAFDMRFHMWKAHIRRGMYILLGISMLIRITYPDDRIFKNYCLTCFASINTARYEEKNTLLKTLDGRWIPAYGQSTDRRKVIVIGSIGRFGYHLPPRAKIIDKIAIADPLLARLPMRRRMSFSTGNTQRKVPKGYVRAARTGDTSRMQPDLAIYYEKLRFIITGDLWSAERLKEIARFNLGYYDEYRKRYLEARARQAISRRKKPSGQSTIATD